MIRKLIMHVQHEKVARVTVSVEEAVANYLNNRKRRELTNLEDEHSIEIIVLSHEDVSPEFLKIVSEDNSGREIRMAGG